MRSISRVPRCQQRKSRRRRRISEWWLPASSEILSRWSIVSSRLVVAGRRADLASEDAQADRGVDEHQGEDEEARTPEHEGKAGMRRRGVGDRDRERDHVGPERDRERTEGGRED